MTQTLSAGSTSTDPDDPMAFAARFGSAMNEAIVMLGIDAGHRSGAFTALAAAGPSTSAALADAAGLSERHLREWLGLMTVGGIVAFDPATEEYRLPAGAAMCLTGDSPMNMGPVSAFLAFTAHHVDAVARTIRHGGGIPYSAYRPEFTGLMDGLNRRLYDQCLVDGYIGAVPGLGDRLRSGAVAADLGCGSGHVVNLLAQAFPASTFVGYDLAEDALEAGRAEAQTLGLGNARFEAIDVAALADEDRFDLVTAFDAIHDQAHPREVLARALRALTPGGTFLMVDAEASSDVARNLDQPNAPWLYGASLFHCMQVSLAEGGEGLGTVWGVETARQLLAEAGFDHVEQLDTPPMDTMNTMFVCRS